MSRVARLPNFALIEISRKSRKKINPRVFNRGSHYRINCHARFNCNHYRCGNEWTSKKVTVELWWNYRKKEKKEAEKKENEDEKNKLKMKKNKLKMKKNKLKKKKMKMKKKKMKLKKRR